jgi:hypothetical protein
MVQRFLRGGEGRIRPRRGGAVPAGAGGIRWKKGGEAAVLAKIKEKGALDLIEFIRILIRDMENGPVIFGGP